MSGFFDPFGSGSSSGIDTTVYGTRINISMNSINDDYIITINLINENGDILNSESIDLPIETLVKSGRYDSETKTIVLILEDNTEIEIPIGDLVSNLQTEITNSNKLNSDLVDDTNSTNKFVSNTEKTNWSNHIANTNNPHQVTKAQIGLDNVDNTSDINKPISTAAQVALDSKVDKETDKGLSTNDYTTTEKTKLAGIDEGAEVNEIESIKVNNTTINPDANKVVNITVPITAADVSALPDTTKYAAALSLTINSSTFVMTGQLKDQNGDNLGTAQTIDLPLESVVVGGSYNSQAKKVVLTLQNGNTIEFSVADLVSGLQTELSASNKLNPAYINYDSTHRAVSDTEKSTWNGKQNALSSAQLDAVNSGIDSAKVAQIETNKNNISTDRAALVELVDGGAKNIVQIGNAVTVTKNGVTAVSNTDGSVTISGVSTSGSQFLIINDLYSGSTTSTYSSQIPIKAGNYVVKATGTRDVLIQAINYNSSTDTEVIDSSNDDVEFTATKSYIVFRLVIRGNTDFTTPVTIYPMCCDSALYAISPEVVPYRPSYQELYEKVETNKNNISSLTAELHALLPNITSSTTIQDYANSLSKGVYTAFIANVSNPPDSPINANCFVNIYVYSASSMAVELIPLAAAEMPRTYTMRKISGTWRGWYMVEGTPVASSTQS